MIGALEAQGIIAGDDVGRFLPDLPLKRAELAKMLVTSLGYQSEAGLLSGYPSRFSDVPSAHWAKGYIESLAETAAVEGYPGGTFGPDDTVDRAQMAVILVRLAGLSEQARLTRFEPSPYQDDAQIPDWARGSVIVARAAGLMNGLEDGTFRPAQAITRAEGAATVFRLKLAQGSAFHLTGTLVKFDPATGQGVVRDSLGQESAFAMAPDASYYRGGVTAVASQVSVLDQVWVVKGTDGVGRFMDARYVDVLGTNLSVAGSNLAFLDGEGRSQSVNVQAGALIYLNGRQATLDQTAGSDQLYVILDSITGEARVVDAVKAPVQGQLAGLDITRAVLTILTSTESKNLSLAPGAVIIVNGQRSALTDLMPGDRLRIAQNDTGAVTYVLAER
jgi:hypothetical protein